MPKKSISHTAPPSLLDTAQQVSFDSYKETLNLIERIFAEFNIQCDMAELYHFSCVLIGTLILRFEEAERTELTAETCKLLLYHADQGKMFYKIMEGRILKNIEQPNHVRASFEELNQANLMTRHTAELLMGLTDIMEGQQLEKPGRLHPDQITKMNHFTDPLINEFHHIVSLTQDKIPFLEEYPSAAAYFLEACAIYTGRLCGLIAGLHNIVPEQLAYAGLKALEGIALHGTLQKATLH